MFCQTTVHNSSSNLLLIEELLGSVQKGMESILYRVCWHPSKPLAMFNVCVLTTLLECSYTYHGSKGVATTMLVTSSCELWLFVPSMAFRKLTRETYMVSAFLVDIINHLKYQQTYQTALLVSLVEHELGLALRDYG